MVRFLVSILLGAAITFTLFVFMAFLVSSGDRTKEEAVDNIIVEVNTTPPKSAAERRQRVPPPPPPPPKTPPKPQAPEPEVNNTNTSGININMPSVSMAGADTGLDGPGAFGKDGDATPIFRTEPKYPNKAKRNGIEGSVTLSFTINEIGGVEDIKIVESVPKRIFDKAAKRALKRWKYNPKIIDGKAQKQVGLTIKLDFNMDSGG